MRWVQLCASSKILCHCLSLGLEWKLTFPSPVVTAEFSKCWHIEFSTFTASSFRIWKSSTGIPSPPLALLGVVLPKAQWTYHSRMSGSRWVITASWLSGSWKFFFFFFWYTSVYFYHLFLIPSASVGSFPFLSFIEPIFAWNIPLASLSFLKRSLVFPILLFPLFLCTDHWGRSYLCELLFELCMQVSISFLFSFAFCFSSFLSYL